MTYTRAHTLKLIQSLLDKDGDIVQIDKTTLQDTYELLTEPYQMPIEDIIAEAEAKNEV